MRAPVAALALAAGCAGLDNGVGRLPPMGWRSWNCFGRDVNQSRMEAIMDRMASRARSVDGAPTSLADLGYVGCGLDDNWQHCGAGAFGSFHAADGSPLIKEERFPSMKAMTDHAHARGLKAGWYMNNCICAEHSWKGATIATHMAGSAKAVADFGFDALKLDGCGQFMNLTWWAELLNATGRPVMIENCHWGNTVPGQATGSGPCSGTTPVSDCPYNFYRTSGDINPKWGVVKRNLRSTTQFQGDPPLSRPGAWAYPDMMEVGRMATYNEDRAHFGAWVITSSPLILSFDLTDDRVTDKVWDIIANPEAIAVSQTWAGHPGRQTATFSPTQQPGGDFVFAVPCAPSDATQRGWAHNGTSGQVTSPDGKCLGAGSNASAPGTPRHGGPSLVLQDCDGSAAQQWARSNGSLLPAAADGQCLDVESGGWGGPAVQVVKCRVRAGGPPANEQFAFAAGMVSTPAGLCLAGRDSWPSWDTDVVELWVKPLGGGRVAAFVLNNGGNVTAHFALTDVGIQGAASMRDVWARRDMGRVEGQFSAALGAHDSALVVFTPQ